MSACLASGVVRGSMTIRIAPRRCAARQCETRWMPEVEGFAPHRMIRRDSGKSVYVTDGILPYIARFAAPVGAAHTVRARRDAPRRLKRVASLVSCVSKPFEPP